MLVEHHPALRDGVLALLNSQPDIEVVGGLAASQPDAFSHFQRHAPDVTIVDAGLPGVTVLISQIRSANSRARIISLVDYEWDGDGLSDTPLETLPCLAKDQIHRSLMPLIRGAGLR
jgi:DNA-binding NarL/FixJ family response regulator